MPAKRFKPSDMCIFRPQGVECPKEEHFTKQCENRCGWNPYVEEELIKKDREKHEAWLKGE